MLEYSPELIDYRLKSYHVNDKHIVRGHLIGTKVGDRGWSVSAETLDDNVKQFIGKDWIVSPKQFDPSEHFLVGQTYDEQIEKQKAVARGKIINVLGPFSYHDGTDDKYYDFEAEVTDPEVSKALVEGRLPFATSPYIWALNEEGKPYHMNEIENINRVGVKNWIPVHEALVTRGTFGDIAVLNKQCLGPEGQCTKALAGSSFEISQILSSQIYKDKQNPSEMDTNPTDNSKVIPETPKIEEVKAPLVEEQKEEAKEQSKIEITQEELADLQSKVKNYNKLVIKDRTRELENIFTNFPDEETKAKIIKKWVVFEENDTLIDFANDIMKFSSLSKKTEKNPLVGNAKEEKATFPLAGNSEDKKHVRLHRDQSLTELLGGTIS